MRRLLVLTICLGVLAATPAAAQEGRRDPFRPLVTEDQGGDIPVGTGTTDTGEQPPASEPAPTTGGGSPNTGMPASDWSAIAYMLIALGAAAVVLARLRRPIVTPTRRR